MKNPNDLLNYLPTTKKEMDLRGWDEVDIIIFTGDAYVDHPSFAAAVIGRTLESHGLRVAVVPQPNWRDDLRDFKKLGRPRLYFAVTAGAMDSMVNHYTANRRRRSDDAYTPDGRADMRPDYPTIIYTGILKKLFPDVPVIIGGIEASLRRVTHYDYWQDKLLPSILVDSGADMLVYGMGEKPQWEITRQMLDGRSIAEIRDVPQTAYLSPVKPQKEKLIELNSHEVCLRDKRLYAANFRHIEEESNKYHSAYIVQKTGDSYVVVNPPYPPMTTDEIDASFDLPYMRLPHPKYKGKTIPAYEMIKFSVNMHRGCFGGCSFCTISAHQGKFIASRSKESILREVKQISEMPGFKGYLSDLGGPSANMYSLSGKDKSLCELCARPSCIQPAICKNLNLDLRPLLEIYHAVDALPYIKKSFVGSGVRYDFIDEEYAEELIRYHVSGRLKVAPEHTSTHVLRLMRKPPFEQFKQFKKFFDKINRQYGLNQQIIPYFISSHPGCRLEDMAELAVETKELDFRLEQVQDFTPTPMTLATEIYYSGYHPYTLEPVYCARTKEDKLQQRQFFFWYKSEFRQQIIRTLRKIGRIDLINKLFSGKKQY
ncbi:MAG: YgiQ family radical SAM protein [Paludibacteraceae bacterium]|nr:YgiQ family radical SAM protein [Paludibacteraceae bacterium]